MKDFKEWHVYIKSPFKLPKNATETIKCCKQKMGRTQVLEWFYKFKSSVISDISGHPATSKTDETVD